MTVFRFPLARVAVFFIGGIVAQHFLKAGAFALGLLLLVTCCLLALYFLFAGKSNHAITSFGITVVFASVAVGAFCVWAHSDLHKKEHYVHVAASPHKPHALRLTIREKLKTTSSHDRYVCTLHNIGNASCVGKILLNLRHGPHRQLAVGSRLALVAAIEKHRKPLNPDQFDYGAYLENKNIYAQVYADSVTTMGITKDHLYYADVLRQRITANLADSGFRNRELQVFNALLLGQQQEISADIVRDYQFAGAVHILSVSGLHVGFVLMLLNLALQSLPQTKYWRLVKLCVAIAGLWGFAVLAGLSPSVVRSVVMFSILAVGMHLRRSTNIFHTLLVSMLLILLFRPNFLFDVGFQLSYLALFFIVWMQPLFARIWNPENFIVRYFWNIVSVSFAAQLGTLPLSLYYFHQFPGLFFVTNLLVIPWLSAIMAVGIATAVWAAVGTVPYFLVWLTQFGIYGLNAIIGFIAGFEKFIFTDIPFNVVLLWTSYLLVISTIYWLLRPNFKKLVIALGFALSFPVIGLWRNRESGRQRELIVFHVPKNTIIAKRNGPTITLKSNRKVTERTFTFALQPYLTASFGEKPVWEKLQNADYFAHNRIFILDSTSTMPETAAPDILLFTQSPKINLDRFLQSHKPQVIIADGSNFRSYVARWQATCEKQKIPFHATAEKGCYRLKETP